MTNILQTALLFCVVSFSGFSSATPLINESFESQNLSNSYVGFLYADAGFNQLVGYVGYGPVGVAAPGWSFSGQAGLSYSDTLWGGVASDGNVFGFLRNGGGEISQTFYNVAGSYSFSVDMGQRTSWRQGGPQTVSVVFDGNTVWSGTPGNSWSTFSFDASQVAAGNHTLSFRGTNLSGASDTSVFVDNVRLTFTPVSAVPEPESCAMMLVGLGLLAAIARRRRTRR
jgi:hypothetical protein